MDTTQIKLLDQRGRVIWSQPGDSETWPKSFLESAADSLAAEAAFAQCVIRGEANDYVGHWDSEGGVVLYWARFFPVGTDIGQVAAVAIVHELPETYFTVTPQETEVLELLAKDLSVKEIATALDRSESTIDQRIRSLKNKLGRETLHGLVGSAVLGRLLHLQSR